MTDPLDRKTVRSKSNTYLNAAARNARNLADALDDMVDTAPSPKLLGRAREQLMKLISNYFSFVSLFNISSNED